MKRILLLLSIICALLGCSTSTQSAYETTVLPWSVSDKISIDDLVDSIYMIPLENTPEAYIRSCYILKADESGIYIIDRLANRLLSFNGDGTMKTSYGRLGKVASIGEYLEAIAFCTDDNNIYSIDNYNKKLFIYNKNTGKFIKTIDMPNYYYDIEKLDNGNFILLWYPHRKEVIDDTKYRLTLADSSMNILKQLHRPTKEDALDAKFSYLTKYDDKITYHFYFTDSVQQLSRKDGTRVNTYAMPLENPIPDDDKIDEDMLDDKRVFTGYNFLGFTCGSPIILDKYVVSTINNSGMEFKAFVYDKENECYIFNNPDKAQRKMFPPYCYYNGYIYSCVQAYELEAAIANGLVIDNKSDFSGSDYIVLKYKLK